MTAHRYWSILITETSTAGSVPAVSEVQMAESAFGANVCSGGTASATSTFSGTSAAGAFNGTFYSNNGAALWSATTAASSVNQRLSYDFGVGVTKDIQSVRILARQTEGVGGGPGQSPRDFDVAYSDDGSTWTVAWSVTGSTGWAEYELRHFHISAPSYSGSPHGTHVYWRLGCLQAAGGAYAGSEMEFHSTPGGAQVATGGTPTAFQSFSGSFLPTNLFDSNTSTLWSSTDKTDPAWVEYQFGTAKAIAEIKWQARNDSFYTQSPSRIVVLWSDDNSAWNMAWSGNTTWASAAQTHLFTDPSFVTESDLTSSQAIGLTEAAIVSLFSPEVDLTISFALGLTEASTFELDIPVVAAAMGVSMSAPLELQFQPVAPALGVAMTAAVIANEVDIVAPFSVGVGQALSPGLITLPGKDILISWLRRDRLGGSPRFVRDNVPMSEAVEKYDVEILIGTTVARSFLGLTTNSVTYTAVQQIADGWTYPPIQLSVRVFQLSAVVGRGFGEVITVNVT